MENKKQEFGKTVNYKSSQNMFENKYLNKLLKGLPEPTRQFGGLVSITVFVILSFPHGSTYEGEWANGFMNGTGTFTWSDGKKKKGIWKNGKLQE